MLAGRAGRAANIGAFGSNRGKKSLEQISKNFTASKLGIGRINSSGIFLIIPVKPKEEKHVNPEFEKDVDEKDEKLVELLDWDSGYQDWHKYLWLMKSIGMNFELFHTMSKTGIERI